MAYSRTAVAPHAFAFTKSPAAPTAPGFWSRVFTAMTAARMRHAKSSAASCPSSRAGDFHAAANRTEFLKEKRTMTTLNVRSLPAPRTWALPNIAALMSAVFDVLAEAQEMARVAHKRYPFAEE